MVEKTKISPIETSDIEINCQLLYGDENNFNNITWRWTFNTNVIEPNNRISITNTYAPNAQSRLSIKEVMMTEKGNYECTAINNFGQATNRININVKSKFIFIREIFVNFN